MLVLGQAGSGIMPGLGFPALSPSSYPIGSCTLSLDPPWWHLTPTERTTLGEAGFWALAFSTEF